ncbi:hypothetical protein C8R46DRAFT_1361128 [Mycena filopes]|nr:hypothetical protein C8R46DRAFT_1361128 [Mycena filopes]
MQPFRPRYLRSHYAHANPFLSFRPTSRPGKPKAASIHNLSSELLVECRREVDEANHEGTILTWSPTTNSKKPSVWHPPHRTTRNGEMTQMAASAYNNVPASKFNGPHCPHAINGFNLAEETLMSAHNTRKRGWFFQAKQHDCEFILNIPPLGSKNIVHPDDSELLEDPNAGHWASSGDEDESFELMALDKKTAEAVRRVNEASDRASTERTSALQSRSIVTLVFILADAFVHPAFLVTSCLFLIPSGPFLIASRRFLLFAPAAADGRMCYDAFFRNHLLDRQASGLYKRYPQEHPAWRSSTFGECVPMLLSFHPRPPAVMPPMTWMTQLGGQMLCQFNSTMGLPKRTLFRLLVQSLECQGCGCLYSVEGYHDHRRLNPQTREFVCTNTPNLSPVQELQPELAGLYDMSTRTYPVGIALPSHSDHINSTLGRAWVAWNSRVGVSKDVWAVLSTAWVHCRDCDLVRTFDADRAHRDSNFLCRDVGQGQVSTVLGATHRVNSADGTMVVWKM